MIEVLDGGSRRVVERNLRSPPERAAVEVVSIDPYDAYRQAIKTALLGARIVAEPFHVVRGASIRGASTALDTLRRERQRLIRAGSCPKGTRRAGKAGWRADLFHARH